MQMTLGKRIAGVTCALVLTGLVGLVWIKRESDRF